MLERRKGGGEGGEGRGGRRKGKGSLDFTCYKRRETGVGKGRGEERIQDGRGTQTYPKSLNIPETMEKKVPSSVILHTSKS
jgi:hypothetical protein